MSSVASDSLQPRNVELWWEENLRVRRPMRADCPGVVSAAVREVAEEPDSGFEILIAAVPGCGI